MFLVWQRKYRGCLGPVWYCNM